MNDRHAPWVRYPAPVNDRRDVPDAATGWNPWRPPSRELLIDRQIREAQEAGKFDELPYRGERIPLEDDSQAGEWALAHHILKNAHMGSRRGSRKTRRFASCSAAATQSWTGRRGLAAWGRKRDRADLERVVLEVNRATAILECGGADGPPAPPPARPRRPSSPHWRSPTGAGRPTLSLSPPALPRG